MSYDGLPSSAIFSPQTRVQVLSTSEVVTPPDGVRGPRPATSLIDMKHQSDRAKRDESPHLADSGEDIDDATPSQAQSTPKSKNQNASGLSTPTSNPVPMGPREIHKSKSTTSTSSPRISSRSKSALNSSSRPKIRTIPHLPHGPGDPSPPTLMYWSRAPVYGHLPMRSMRAHTVTLVDSSTAWLFGGCDDKGCAKDVYLFDIETCQWSHPLLTGDMPPPCRAHTATLVDRRIFFFGGGEGPSYYNTLYMLDTQTRRWTHIQPPEPLPAPRRAHTAVLYRGKLWIFGGGNGVKALNDVWCLDTTVSPEKMKWEGPLKTHGPRPGPRGYHTANLVGNIMIVIGGSDGRDCFSDIWVLNLDTLAWTLVDTDKEYKRLSHSSTQVGSYLFIMGGHDGLKYSNELLLFNLVTLQYESKPPAGRPPTSRGYHISLLADARLWLFGGFDGHSVYDDVWMLDLAGAAYLPQVTSFALMVDGDN